MEKNLIPWKKGKTVKINVPESISEKVLIYARLLDNDIDVLKKYISLTEKLEKAQDMFAILNIDNHSSST